MRAQRSVALAGFVCLIVVAADNAHAQQFVPAGRDTLRGLPGVEVLIEPLALELAQSGLTAPAIATSITQQLRESGIAVYASQMANPSPAKAYLYVQVSGFALQRQGYVLGLQVHLRQTLRSPVTSSNVVNAMTWDQQLVLFAPAGSSMQLVQNEVRRLVNLFAQDWQAVH